MKRILLALSALAIGTAAASAADLAPKYTKAPPAPLPPPCIWCGFYIGLNGGWVGNTGSNDNNNLSAISIDPIGGVIGPVFATTNNQNTNGGFGGGQIGYNWVFPGGTTGAGGGWLVGVEADIQGASLHGNAATVSFFGDDGNFNTATADSRLNWFGTVRGRLGFATGPVLFYGTGGFAFGGVKNNLLVSFADDAADCIVGVTAVACSASTLVTNNSTRTGWVAGAGIEWMFAPNWSLKGEYQFIDLGSITQTAGAFTADLTEGLLPEGTVATRRVNERFNTVRVGINYHFNWGSPVGPGY